MTIELGIWCIDGGLSDVRFEPMTARLKGPLVEIISIAAPHPLVIGRQVRAAFDKTIDPLAIGEHCSLAIMEPKGRQDITRHNGSGPRLRLRI